MHNIFNYQFIGSLAECDLTTTEIESDRDTEGRPHRVRNSAWVTTLIPNILVCKSLLM